VTAPVRVAVIGTGFAARAHLDALRRVGGAEVAAVIGSDPARARAVADEFGVPGTSAELTAVLQDDTVDAVHNCTANDQHLPANLAALRAGKHVLSEKPLALNSDDTAVLATAAEQADRVAAVCFTYRHYPMIAQGRAELADAGPAHLVHGGYQQDWLLFDDDYNWRIDPAVGGPLRAVADIGSHWIDLIQHMTGDRVTEVLADLGQLHPVRRRPTGSVQTFAAAGEGETEPVQVTTEDFATVLLRFASGMRGACSVSQVCAGHKNRLEFVIEASRSSYGWNQEEPNTLHIGHRDRPNTQLLRDLAHLAPPAAAMTRYPAGHPEGWPDALRNQVADFHRAIRAHRDGDGAPHTIATFAQAHQVMLVCDAIGASARDGVWTSVPTTTGSEP
jgi:predicted dehydrogenase